MTFPVTYTRLKVQHFVDWLEPQLISDAPITVGRLPVGQPNRAIGIIASGGRALEMDGVIDPIAYTVLSRGGADNFSDAEDIAYEVDTVILQSPTDFDIAENVHVESIDRQSGAPFAAPITDAQSRWVFNCIYVVRNVLTVYNN
jgi:hypothetical protein